MTKTEKQDKIAMDLYNNGGGIVYGATGIGKTRIIIETLKKFESNSLYKLKCFWVVPEVRLRDEEIPSELKIWGFGYQERKMNIIPVCYKSFNEEYNGADIVVLDEMHHITPDNTQNLISKRPGVIIAGTASKPSAQEKKDIISELGLKVVYELSVMDAKEAGYVNNFELFIYRIPLNKTDAYIKKNKNDTTLITEAKKYENIQFMLAKIKQTNGRIPMSMALVRKRFLQNLKSKETFAKILIKKLNDANIRHLIFCPSIEQADRLCKHTYHSQEKDVSVIENFNTERINSFSCVRAMDEGHNLKNLKAVIILNLDAEARTMIQRIGRAIRVSEDGEHSKIYIVIAKGTKEEEWLDNIIEEQKLHDLKITYHDI